ncbi:MAG TPA: class I SAM-dependent methyltransferase [Candidatus Paceibacterota bacterium]|nr:class I SAM-dependent methyltransferase [Candidatus Paceibacterota bacterium]
MKPPLKTKYLNDFQTPPAALESLYPYLKKDWLIWEPACGKGNLVNALAEHGYSVRATDITGGIDFLTIPPAPFDCIITNPPYSLKQQFLERCYELGRPFALLLPITAFETEKRQALFRKYGVEVVFLPKRLNFETPSGKGAGSWFATMWITNGLNIHKELTFSQ